MTCCVLGLLVMSLVVLVRVMISPESLLLRHSTRPSPLRLWRWRCVKELATLDFGPHHLLMSSMGMLSLTPELSLYEIDSSGQHGVFREWGSRHVWGEFHLHPKTRRMHILLNRTVVRCRPVHPTSRRYGWYVDDTIDHVAVVATSQRAALFRLPSPRGAWVAVDESDFTFLGGLLIHNVSLMRI